MRSRRTREERGAVVVEFALIVPMLLLLVFGILEFGYMMSRDTAIDNAARGGAREASLGGTFDDVCQSVKADLTGAGIPVATSSSCNTTQTTKATIRIDCIKPDRLTPCNASTNQTGYDAGAESGGTATIKVTYAYKWITPLVSSLFGANATLEQSTRMRIE